MKKKHIGLKILLGFIVLLLLVTVGLFVRFYPVYKDAKFLAENFSLTCLTYEFEAEINREELQEKVGEVVQIEIVMDPDLSESQCIIDADSGVYDCSLDVELDNLIRDLRSLGV